MVRSVSIDRLVYDSLEIALRPLLSFALKHSLKLNDLIEVLKTAAVAAAQKELSARGDAGSISRLSIMTGVHRRDVARILNAEDRPRQGPTLISKVLGQWRMDKRFLGKNGAPKALGVSGMESEFAKLVRSVSADLAPYTVLYELDRMKLIKRTGDLVRMQSPVVISSGDIKAGFTMLGDDLRDLTMAVVQNVSEQGSEKNLHLKTDFNRIPQKAVPRIKKWIRREGSRFHKRAEDFLSRFDLDLHPNQSDGGPVVRAAVGSYGIIEEIEVE